MLPFQWESWIEEGREREGKSVQRLTRCMASLSACLCWWEHPQGFSPSFIITHSLAQFNKLLALFNNYGAVAVFSWGGGGKGV